MMLMEGKGIAPNYVEAAVHLQAAAAHQVPQVRYLDHDSLPGSYLTFYVLGVALLGLTL